jgi:phosphoesterase RecJ-like protein
MAELAQRVAGAQNVMITTHEKPDGDALGSSIALHKALTAQGKRVDIFFAGPIERCLERIAGDTPFLRVEDGEPGDDYDLIIVVDTGAWSQVPSLDAWLRSRRALIIGLDHHPQGDDMASQRVVDIEAASAAQLILRLLDELGCPITPGRGGIAEALFVGLATDTGWFRFNSAGAEVFRVAARLLELNVNKTALFEIIEATFKPSRIALEARALSAIDYVCDGTVAIMSLTQADFEQTGGSTTDLTSLVNRPMLVEQVRVSVLLAETEPGRTKVSLRSKPAAVGRDSSDYVNVNLVAGKLGGGGHAHAAGARLDQPLAKAKKAVVSALQS